ncbi:MAG: MFS transporter [Myxococcota bacterium]
MPDRILGERAAAYVELRPGTALDSKRCAPTCRPKASRAALARGAGRPARVAAGRRQQGREGQLREDAKRRFGDALDEDLLARTRAVDRADDRHWKLPPAMGGSPASRMWTARELWIVLGCLICQMGLGLTYVTRGLSADLIEALDLTRAQFSGANVPQLTFQALASPVAGWLTVRYGASRVLAASSLLFAGVFFVYARAESIVGFYCAMAGVGLGAAGMGDITVGHVVARWVRRHRGLALGIAYAGSNVGGWAMVRLTGAVAERWDFRAGLLAVVAFSLLVLLPASLFLIRDRDDAGDARATNDAAADARLDRPADAQADRPPDDPRDAPGGQEGDALDLDLAAALRTPTFWILTSTLFSFFFYFTGALDHLVLFLTDAGLSREEARGHLSLAIALGIVSKLAGGWIADRIPHERSILYDYALLAFSSFVLLALPNPVLLPVFVYTFGFSQAARDVVYPLVIERCFGTRHLGSIYGMMTLTLLPGAVLGPLLAATLRDTLGDYRIAFMIFAAMNTASVAALFFVRDERARRIARTR